MSGLRPVENEKYEPKFDKHKYVSITSSADQISASAALKQATPTGKAVQQPLKDKNIKNV